MPPTAPTAHSAKPICAPLARLAAGLFCIALALPVGARDSRVPREFKRLHVCPATDLPRGPCPGWIIDHIIPLCAGGPDRIDNLQWQMTADAKAKDREEARLCRALRKKTLAPLLTS